MTLPSTKTFVFPENGTQSCTPAEIERLIMTLEVMLTEPYEVDCQMTELEAIVKFRTMINRYCMAIEGLCRQGNLEDDKAVIYFRNIPDFMKPNFFYQECEKPIFIKRFGTKLEFLMPSRIQCASDNLSPHLFSTFMLKRNAEKTIGMWCISKVQGYQTFCYKHMAEMRTIDGHYFAEILSELLRQCLLVEDYVLPHIEMSKIRHTEYVGW